MLSKYVHQCMLQLHLYVRVCLSVSAPMPLSSDCIILRIAAPFLKAIATDHEYSAHGLGTVDAV